MRDRASAAHRVLLGAGALAGVLPAAASAQDAVSLPGLLFPDVLTNMALAASIVLLFVFGLYAWASLARVAPYHSWIYLYLVSLTGIAWAVFLWMAGGSPADVVFLLTTVAGINLIVHVLRFDRVEIPSPFGASAAPVRPG
jgi:hypothetical protein